MEDAIRIADRWYVLVTSSHADDRTRVQKYGDTFGVFDRHGDVPSVGTGVHGLYHEGTRFLSRFELRTSGRRPLLLNSSVREDNGLLTADLSTPDLRDGERLIVPKETVHVFRARLLGSGSCQEHVRVTNYGSQPVALTLTYDFAADYLDIFEVRGFSARGAASRLRRRPGPTGRSSPILDSTACSGAPAWSSRRRPTSSVRTTPPSR